MDRFGFPLYVYDSLIKEEAPHFHSHHNNNIVKDALVRVCGRIH